MFARLFAQSGLSLDRLRALVEVGACGGIVRAAEGDPARQSQFSRQLKELEDFFQIGLVERHGKGVRLTAHGRELARISRFFLLGLSNFQRGCLAEDQTFRIGASGTFITRFLLPLLARPATAQARVRFTVESVTAAEVERRLHDLTLDFGVVTQTTLSRPLQLRELGRWRLKLWVPRALCRSASQAARAFQAGELPLALPLGELPCEEIAGLRDREPDLTCGTFLEARTALVEQGVATLLPDFLDPEGGRGTLLNPRVPALDALVFCHALAWNPRLLRLNPHAARRRDALIAALGSQFPRALRSQTKA
jgi:DNA-binding transcriptional LysR family regulator